MSERFVLAIDAGTTGVTVLIFDRHANIKARAYSEFTQHFPRPGWVEHDAEEIWRVTHAGMTQALRGAGLTPADIAALGLTNQRETVVLWDRQTGEPVHPAIVWQDRRTAADCARLKADGHERMVRKKTGLVLDPYFSATKIRWLLDNVPGLRRRARRGGIAFGTIDSWLLWKLTGGAVHATDPSNAARTLLYDIRKLRWDDDLVELFAVPRALLPEVRPSSAVHGHTRPGLFADADAPIPVSGIAGDQQAALFGQACFQPGRAKNTYGTGSFILMNIGAKPARGDERLLTTLAWQLEGRPAEYALEGAVFISGAGVQWLRDGLGIIDKASDTEALAASLAGNDDVYFVPALVGLGAPHWDPFARGALLGITRGTTRAHVVRATLESICYQTRDVVEAMTRDAKIELQELRCDGGAAVNAFLMQFQADILDVPVTVPEVVETTALGAAYLAGLAVGYWRDLSEIEANWRLARRYTPRMDGATRKRLCKRWRRAVERAKNWSDEGNA